MENIAECVFVDGRVGKFPQILGQCKDLLAGITVSTVRLYRKRRIRLISRLYGRDSIKHDEILMDIDELLAFVKSSAN